jgi:sugar O-acyltransferase (sialic acid O-acetyltransferase NeuD family)
MKPLVIFGAAGFAEMAHYYFERDSDYSVVAFTVDAPYIVEATFQGLPVIPVEELKATFPPDQTTMFVAMGIQKVNQLRAAKVAEVEAQGYRLASYLSTRARVPDDLVLKPNTFIMEEVGLQPRVTVGRNSILWPRTNVGFGSRIGDHCWLVTATLGESVTVGDYTFIGINATIRPSRTIAPSNVIGAGALILEDTKEFAVYKGNASKASRVPSYRLLRNWI